MAAVLEAPEQSDLKLKEYTIVHYYCGSGGGGRGSKKARRQFRGMLGSLRTVAAFDCDPLAVADYPLLTGDKATQLDLFSYHQYVCFHSRWSKKIEDKARIAELEAIRKDPDRARGVIISTFRRTDQPEEQGRFLNISGNWFELLRRVDPPADWKEVTPEDIRRMCGFKAPDVVFLSPPCKGFSGLLGKRAAESPKYWALNNLTVRGILLHLAAFKDDPSALIILENVPRIAQRGKALLNEIVALLMDFGYADPVMGFHDCGPIGGLAQHRKRFLLGARHPKKCASWVHEVRPQPMQTVGDVIGQLPPPGHPALGPMGRMPKLSWITWFRLACIPAGGDWRDLEKVYEDFKAGRLVLLGPHGQPIDASEDPTPKYGRGPYYIMPVGVPGAPPMPVPDFRVPQARDNFMRVGEWDKPSLTVTGNTSVSRSNGMGAVADERVPGHMPGDAAQDVLDVRVRHASDDTHAKKYLVLPSDGPYSTVTGSRLGSGMAAIADDRGPEEPPGPDEIPMPAVPANLALPPAPNGVRHDSKYKVQPWDQPSRTVDGTHKGVGSGQACIQDLRVPQSANRHLSHFRVAEFEGRAGTVTGATHIANGAQVVQDIRPNWSGRNGTMGVLDWDKPGTTVTGSGDVYAGTAAVQDVRTGKEYFGHTYEVTDWDGQAGTVTSAHSPSNGGKVVADPRGEVMEFWAHDEGPVILTWDFKRQRWARHRPVVTLELGLFQGLPLYMENGAVLNLSGKSDARKRERIGNMVPPPAAQAILEIFLVTLMCGLEKVFDFSMGKVWFSPEGEVIPPPFEPVAHLH